MSSFSHHNSSLETDSVFSPNSPLKNYGVLDELFPNWNELFNSFEQIPLPLPHIESSSIDDVSNHGRSFESFSMAEKQGTQSFSSMAESWEQVSQVCSSLHKKRKSRNGSSSNSANFEDVKNTKSKKQKGDKEAKKEDKKCEKKEEPPKGYIHVRARRGQATDSHSLAERVRRGKLSEKMKMLQGLVPGCDKVTGKALMLDEIINYVQSLQTQVEFLSMRLASLDPMVYNFGLPFMPFENQEFTNNNTQTQTGATVTFTSNGSTTESVNFINPNTMCSSITNNETVQLSSFTPNAIVTTTSTTTVDPTAFPSLHIVDSSTNLLGQKASVLTIQDDRILYWGSGIEDQNRLGFFSQFGFGPTN